MSVHPPPPGHAAAPPGYGPPRPPSRGNANGVVAAAVAGVVIVVGVVTTVLLVTSDANTRARAGLGSERPTGSQRPAPSVRPSLPGADLAAATAAGNAYFGFLDAQLYYSSRGRWCEAVAFPLTEDDVEAVTSAYPLGGAQGSSTLATMPGHVSLDDGRSGSVTVYLRPIAGAGSPWCISSQSSLS